MLQLVAIGQSDMVLMFFFFQAEDGIRDLVRSRGLGDVYKRQAEGHGARDVLRHEVPGRRYCERSTARDGIEQPAPVSYTHLTLPTSDLV